MKTLRKSKYTLDNGIQLHFKCKCKCGAKVKIENTDDVFYEFDLYNIFGYICPGCGYPNKFKHSKQKYIIEQIQRRGIDFDEYKRIAFDCNNSIKYKKGDYVDWIKHWIYYFDKFHLPYPIELIKYLNRYQKG